VKGKEDDTSLGVTTVRTPYGLGEKEWRLGIQRYSEVQQNATY